MQRQTYDIGIRVPYFVSVKESPRQKSSEVSAELHRVMNKDAANASPSLGVDDVDSPSEYKNGFHVSIERDWFIGISGSKIARSCAWKEIAGDAIAHSQLNASVKEWIKAPHHVAMPGLVNAHIHFPMSLFRGLADDAPMQKWLHDYIFPLEAKLADTSFAKTGTELSLLEAIRCGTTTFGDSYFHEETIAEVVARAGVRAVLAETTHNYPTPNNPNADASIYPVILETVAKYRDNPLVEIGVGAHAPYTCSDAKFREVNEFALENRMKMMVHVSETKFEVEESYRQYGKSPVVRMRDLGLMRPGMILAHAIHLDVVDRDILEQSGASVVYNPESNMKLGAGAAPIVDYLRRRIPMGLGTDGSASNNNLNLFLEMDTGAKLQKLVNGDNTAMTAPSALYLATLGGAHALGLGDRTGSIEEGKDADVVLLNLDHPHLRPHHDILSLLVYAANGSEVDTVICAGKVLFSGNHTEENWKTLDRDRIFRDVLGQEERIRKEVGF